MHACKVLAFIFLLTSCVHRVAGPSSVSAPGLPAWELLKATLPGSWATPTRKGAFVVSYRLISGESVLVETWGAGTPSETETLFYPDHGQLLLTHFCAQGNQARLQLKSMEGKSLVFRRLDVTNHLPGQSVLQQLILRFQENSLERVETYEDAKGHAETSALQFKRHAPSSAPIP